MNPNITIMQEKAIQLLLAGATVAAAARELGIDRTTIYAWHKSSPVFALACTSARSLQSQIIADSLQDLASAAIDTLRDILVSPDAPPSVRLRAAQSVLNACTNNKHESQAPPSHPLQELSTHFDTSDEKDAAAALTSPFRRESPKTGRNELCPCSSGLKFKRCCGDPVRINQHQAAAAA